MRIGENPAKKKQLNTATAYHRVVVPVYIPNLEEDYFKNSFEILKYCLGSLIKTIHSKTRISIYNNGCCETVSDYLTKLVQEQDGIDQLLYSKTNIGKINAVNSCVRGNTEQLFTITDADVLFKEGWQDAVEEVFELFPQAGMVSPVPVSNMYKHEDASSSFGHGFSKGIVGFTDVLDRDGLLKFQASVGSVLFEGIRLEKFLCLKHKKGKAVVGCGHFVATLRKEVFEKSPRIPTPDLISKTSDRDYIDRPNNAQGFLRLATLDNYAYHMGNTPEPWMEQMCNRIEKTALEPRFSMNFPVAVRKPWLIRFYYKKIFRLFIQTSLVRRWYFRSIGMTDPNY